MSAFDFLVTPQGQELTHAVVVLIVAISAWFSYRTHKYVADAKRGSQGSRASDTKENSTR